MASQKVFKMSIILSLMIFTIMMTIPLSTEIFELMNASNTTSNIFGLFLYLSMWIFTIITEYILFEQLKKTYQS
jgi:hypothetical protein